MEAFQVATGKPPMTKGILAPHVEKICERPYMDRLNSWRPPNNYTFTVISEETPDEEEKEPMEERMLGAMEAGDSAILLTGHPLKAKMVLWYTVGYRVQQVGQLLSITSLSMSSFRYPRTSMALAVAGFAVWGVHSAVWNTGVKSNYDMHPESLSETTQTDLQDEALLFRKRNRSKIFNLGTVLTACGLAAGVYAWVKYKI